MTFKLLIFLFSLSTQVATEGSGNQSFNAVLFTAVLLSNTFDDVSIQKQVIAAYTFYLYIVCCFVPTNIIYSITDELDPVVVYWFQISDDKHSYLHCHQFVRFMCFSQRELFLCIQLLRERYTSLCNMAI